MAIQSQFPDGFKRERPSFDPSMYGDTWDHSGSDSRTKLNKEDLEKSLSLNKETLKALQTIGKGIDAVLYSEKKSFDTYLSEVKDITEKQQDLEMQIEAERKQSEKRNKEELRILLSHISQLSGLKENDVAKALSDKNSEMFKNLPTELSESLAILLKENSSVLNTIVKENEEIAKKEKEAYEERKKKEKEFFGNLLEKTNDVFDKNSDSLRQSLLGPVNLLLGPMEEFFGFDLYKSAKSFLFGSEGKRGEEDKKGVVQKIGEKIFKKRPSVNDVAKTGDMGSLLINNTLQEVYGTKKTKDGGEDGFGDSMFGSMMGGLLTKMVPSLLAALPGFLSIAVPALIAGGLLVGLIAALLDKETMEKWNAAKEASTQARADHYMASPETYSTLQYHGAVSPGTVAPAPIVTSSHQNQLTTKWQNIVAKKDVDNDAKKLYDMITNSTRTGEYAGEPELFIANIIRGEGRSTNKTWTPLLNKFHKGGIIGQDALSNPNQILAQRGEVILPISESNYGLSSGMLKPTPDGGMSIDRSFMSYNPPAISLPAQNRIEETTSVYNTQETSSSTPLSTENIESKLDSMINLLQSLLSKEPIRIPSPKQSNADLELLIYGGAF